MARTAVRTAVRLAKGETVPELAEVPVPLVKPPVYSSAVHTPPQPQKSAGQEPGRQTPIRD
jgi:hypothetical protein